MGNFNVQRVEINLMFISMQNSTSSLTSFWSYYQDITNLQFWELWECLTIPIKIILSICGKLSCFTACQNQLQIDIANKYQTCYFGSFGHVWPYTSKIIYHFVETFNVYLQANFKLQIINFILHGFLEKLERYANYFEYFGHLG